MKQLQDLWALIGAWIYDCFKPCLQVVQIEGDTLPKKFGRHKLIHLIDDGDSWSAGFYCPCGCGDVLEIALLYGVKPRWELTTDCKGRPTLYPSIWRKTGCQSHFWIRQGRVQWCGPG